MNKDNPIFQEGYTAGFSDLQRERVSSYYKGFNEGYAEANSVKMDVYLEAEDRGFTAGVRTSIWMSQVLSVMLLIAIATAIYFCVYPRCHMAPLGLPLIIPR